LEYLPVIYSYLTLLVPKPLPWKALGAEAETLASDRKSPSVPAYPQAGPFTKGGSNKVTF